MEKSNNPPCRIRILTGPPRSGKTQAIIDQILPFIKENRTSEILILVPSNLKAEEIRQTLLSQKGVSGFLGLRILTFLDLTLLAFQDSTLPGRVSTPLSRRWMIQAILAQLPFQHFKEVKETRGLADLCVEFIRTLKEAGISPEEFHEKTGPGNSSPKLREMGAIFRAYEEEREKQNLLDREDLFSLATRDLMQNPDGPLSRIRTLVITGFYDFTPLQLQLLSALSGLKTMETVLVTLLHQKGRGPGQRFTERALERIRLFFPEAETTCPDHGTGRAGHPMDHLSRHFLTGPEETEEIPCHDSIQIIHTPGHYREVEEIARKIRHLVHKRSHSFKEMGVIFRHMDNYQEKIREVFRFYKIPHRMAGGFPLRTNPLVQALIGILEVPRTGFQREAVIRLLRSDYLKFDSLKQCKISAERFDTLAREAMIHGGKEEWKRRFASRVKNLEVRIQYLEEGKIDDPDPDLRARRIREYTKKIEDYSECSEIMEALIQTLSIISGRASIRKYVEALQDLIRTFGVEQEIYTLKDLRLTRRDQTALKKIQELLSQMMAEHTAMESGREIPLSEFIRILSLCLTEASYSPDPPCEDAVLVTDAMDARELRRPVVFVAGLVEESFPRAHAPNPVFGDGERARLNKILEPQRWIPLSAHWREEEELLFLLAAGAATDRLFLTYPRTDAKARDLLPSRYIDRVRSLFRQGTLVETEVSLEDPLPDRQYLFRNKELLEHTFRGLFRSVSQTSEAPLLFNHLLSDQDEKVRSLLHGLRVMQARADQEGAYTGKLGAEASALLRANEAPYSVTALETYGTCPFQYLCERELKVQPLEEVEDEIGAMDVGSLYHRILERFYRETGGPVTPENLSKAREQMHTIIDRHLSTQEFRGVPGHNKLWEIRRQEVHETLDRFLDKEKEEHEQTGAVPAHFEVSFGMEPRAASDPLSTAEPLTIESEGGPIRVMGKVDRIDLSEKESAPLFSIVDYKTGKRAPDTRQIMAGESLQLPVYADWVKKAFADKREMGRGFFYLLRTGEKKCQIPTKNETWEELRAITRKHIQDYVASIRKGEFLVTEKKCPDYCRLTHICRIKEE